MYRSFLSWRYLVSRPTNLIGIVGILVGVGALILILSIMTGFLEESRRTVRGALADAIVTPAIGERGPGGVISGKAEPLLKHLRADPRIAAATPQLQYFGIITQKGERGRDYERVLSDQRNVGMLGIQLVGIDVDGVGRIAWPTLRVAVRCLGGWLPRAHVQDELDATAFLRSLVGDGSEDFWTDAPVNPLFPFAPPQTRYRGPPRAGVVIGEQLYRQLGMRVGEPIELTTAVIDPASGEPKPSNREFVIAGTFRTRDNETDLGRVYMDRRELADFLGRTREYSQVLLKLVDYDRDGAALVADLRADLAAKGLILGGRNAVREVSTWEDFRGNLLGAIENERVLMAIMLSLVLLVAGFTIFAILSMMVTEKRRDIGILTALGATPAGVRRTFLMIAFWDALLGGLMGGVLGVWGALKIDAIERGLSRMLGIQIFNRDVYLFDHIPAVVQPLWVGVIVLGAFLCALLFAYIPAWRASRLDPLEALRYE